MISVDEKEGMGSYDIAISALGYVDVRLESVLGFTFLVSSSSLIEIVCLLHR
jgi:hypothetical protein